ncbi:MAG: hypothetical protein JST62_10995 [Bacteroidetes bacterium]|nr:hypothetical protein [Bacteroidota bacterium]
MAKEKIAITPTNSCTPKEPFIKLDENGKASILNYNLPQSTSYNATSFLSLDIPESSFITNPVSTFWADLKNKTVEELVQLILQDINTKGTIGIFENINLIDRPNVVFFEPLPTTGIELSEAGKILQEKSQRVQTPTEFLTDQYEVTVVTTNPQPISINPNTGSTTTNPIPNSPVATFLIVRAYIPINYTAQMIKQGKRPVLYSNPLGTVVQTNYVQVEDPKTEKPELLIALELKMSSFLGNYGAGKTLKTFSLLPGEKTNISIRTYQHDETTKVLAQNVLDSYSQSSAEDLQNTIQNEVNHTTSYSQSQTQTKTKNWKAGGSFGLNLGILKIGGGGGGGSSSTTTNSVNSALQTQVGMLVGSTSHHVAKSDSLRQIEINSETSSTSISEYEETITRELENINKSRVLNFVFRQLLQEFLSITYVNDVSFIYYGGIDNSKSCRIATLDDLLNEVLKPEAIDSVKNMIYTQLCNIKDYQGNSNSLIEKVSESLNNCINPAPTPETVEYVRVKKNLTQTYEEHNVNGIIVDVTYRILRTPSLVVDSLLGQGEALDCYNIKLQDAATYNAQIQNDKLVQAIKIIDQIEDPLEKAKLYKKVFTDCCDVPQSGCNCNQ